MTPTVWTRPAGALLGLHAQTALHPGAGTALGAVDLPVQRERHTHYPTIAGSALKGILRDACRNALVHNGQLNSEELIREADRDLKPRERADRSLTLATLFGPPTSDSSEFGGALSVTDARILAFPVRSLRGVFAWVTCSQVLERLQRDAELAGLTGLPPVASIRAEPNRARIVDGCPCLIDTRLVLEEFEFERDSKLLEPSLAEWIIRHLLPDTSGYKGTRERFKKHLVVLSDDDFGHFVRHATEVSARVGLNYETKTVKEGALFYQEFLPTETLFYAVVLMNASRSRRDATPSELLQQLGKLLPPIVQVGGDETTGKGYCAVRLGGGQ